MAHLAALTKRIRIGTSVLIIPYRNPVVTAKMLATLDVLSGGRIILGAGVGWMEEEFQALKAPSVSRSAGGSPTSSSASCGRCGSVSRWTSRASTTRSARSARCPSPLQKGGIPVWIGGHTEPALRRAGQVADGWHPIGLRPPGLLEPEEYAEKVAVIRDWARKAGRDPAGHHPVLPRSARAPPARRQARGRRPALFRGTAAEVIQDIRTYQRLGVTHFVFDLPPRISRARWRSSSASPRTCVPRSSDSRDSAAHAGLCPSPSPASSPRGRVGRLGTADAHGQPHVVPFCYAFDGARALLRRRRQAQAGRRRALKRIRNIRANPRCASIIDEYDEDWSRLRYVIIQGRAEVAHRRARSSAAAPISSLDKYPQYRAMGLPPRAGHHDQGDAGPRDATGASTR